MSHKPKQSLSFYKAHDWCPKLKISRKFGMNWVSCQIVLLVFHTHFSWTFGVASRKGDRAKLQLLLHSRYNFKYVCLCFLLYSFVARKVVMFVPPHITWSRAHRGGLSSVSFWLHHCKLWKEEEEVVHNSQPLLSPFFGGFLIDNDTRRSAPPLDIFFYFIIVDDDNKRRMFKLIFWFCFLIISCRWWWQEEEHSIPSHIFLFLHVHG
jgi:hypothetical protein